MTQDNSLPTERDFDPWNGNLDAQHAWRNFGRMTIEEAKAKFRQNPLDYQEDFMCMGGRAFAYYFPVIDDYLRTVPEIADYDDHQAWSLAHAIRAQFDGANCPHVRHLASRVRDLADFVCRNIHRFGVDDRERQRVSEAWTELVRHLQAVSES